MKSRRRDHCSRCDTVPSDIMVLECGHPLCLGCASVLLTSSDFIQCCQCCKATYLEGHIITELQTLCNKQGNDDIDTLHHSRQIKIEGRSDCFELARKLQVRKTTAANHNPYQRNKLRENIQGRPAVGEMGRPAVGEMGRPTVGEMGRPTVGEIGIATLKASRHHQLYTDHKHMETVLEEEDNQAYCREHAEFQIIYLCLTCLQHSLHQASGQADSTRCLVCPECIIHGQHHGHQVQTVSKYLASTATHTLNAHLQRLQHCLEALSETGGLQKHMLISKNEEVSLMKANACKKYEGLHKQLKDEEEAVMKVCDDLLEICSRQYSRIEEWVAQDQSVLMRRREEVEQLLQPICVHSSSNLKNKRMKQSELKAVSQYLEFENRQCSNSNGQTGEESLFTGLKMRNYLIDSQHRQSRDQDYEESVEKLGNRIQGLHISVIESNTDNGYERPIRHSQSQLPNSRVKAQVRISDQHNFQRPNKHIIEPYEGLKLPKQDYPLSQNSQMAINLLKGSKMSQLIQEDEVKAPQHRCKTKESPSDSLAVKKRKKKRTEPNQQNFLVF